VIAYFFNWKSLNLSLPTSLSHGEREEQQEIRVLAPLSDTERGWGRGQKKLVELTLKQPIVPRK
jgi:hypothetical protein